jgi:hypothetical protein
MCRGIQSRTTSKRLAMPVLLLCAAVFGASQADALTVSKGAVSKLGTCSDGRGLPGCTFCSTSQQKCYMVQSCKGTKCTVITVEDQRPGSGGSKPISGGATSEKLGTTSLSAHGKSGLTTTTTTTVNPALNPGLTTPDTKLKLPASGTTTLGR